MALAPWINSDDAGQTALYTGASQPSPWDVVIIGDVTLPGISTVTATPSKRLDQKKAAGRDGATPTFVGITPSQVDVHTKVWTAKQWNALQQAIGYLWPTSEGAKKQDTYNQSMEISHPALTALRINKVVIQSCTAPSIAERGFIAVTFRCVEYIPPTAKSATKTVTKTTPATSAVSPAVNPALQLSPTDGAPRIASSVNDTQSLPSDDPLFTGPNG